MFFKINKDSYAIGIWWIKKMDTPGYLLHSQQIHKILFLTAAQCILLGREITGLPNSTWYVFLLPISEPNTLRKISGYR